MTGGVTFQREQGVTFRRELTRDFGSARVPSLPGAGSVSQRRGYRARPRAPEPLDDAVIVVAKTVSGRWRPVAPRWCRFSDGHARCCESRLAPCRRQKASSASVKRKPFFIECKTTSAFAFSISGSRGTPSLDVGDVRVRMVDYIRPAIAPITGASAASHEPSGLSVHHDRLGARAGDDSSGRCRQRDLAAAT
jgi:hypothetical protein